MNKLKYEGNLKKYILMARSKFNMPKEILKCVIGNIITYVIIAIPLNELNFFTSVGVPYAFLIWTSFVAVGMVFTDIANIKRTKIKFNNKKCSAIDELDAISEILDDVMEQRYNACIGIDDLKRAKIEETTSILEKRVGKNIITTTQKDRNFYFLDSSDNLQILNEKRYSDGRDSTLELLDGEEKEQLTQNVAKRLVFVRK